MNSIKNCSILILTLLMSLLLVTSCQKDDGISSDNDPQTTIPDLFSEYFGNQISRDFIGTVVDANHNPIEGVTISINNETVLTDSNGVFILNDAIVNERFGYVKAEKAGYIHGSRSVVPANGANKVTIMLLEETIIGSLTSGTSGTITAADGSSVSFDGNFVKENGSSYSGSVNVIMHHLDPTNADTAMQMPGMLYAENTNGEERMLQTLGMLAVELRGANGEDLNLSEGSTSEIRIPVDPSLTSMAPATIPLWYFDEAKGYWIEEGVATLQGNMYVGTVSHFSFWNCDIPAEAITLCVTATNENGDVLNNLKVGITSTVFGTTDGYTNQNGEVCGYTPSNGSLVINVYNSELCGEATLYTQTIGPYNQDASITVIIPDNPNVIQEQVIGTFNTCNNDAVTNGYANLTYGNISFVDVVNNGSFEINLLRCTDADSFSIEAIDFENIQSSGSINYTFTTPLTTIGTIKACSEITEFIQYTIDDNEAVVFTDNLSVDLFSGGTENPQLWISSSSEIQLEQFFFVYFLDNTPPYTGEYGVRSFNDTGIGFNSETSDLPFYLNLPDNTVTSNITSFGEVGEYIDINFSGDFTDSDNNRHSVNGAIHVLRDE